MQGDLARAYFEEALALFREAGFVDGVADTLLELGRVALTQGDDSRTAECFAERLEPHLDTRGRQTRL